MRVARCRGIEKGLLGVLYEVILIPPTERQADVGACSVLCCMTPPSLHVRFVSGTKFEHYH